MMNAQRLEQHDINTISVIRSTLCGLVIILGVGGMATFLSDDESEGQVMAETESVYPNDDIEIAEDDVTEEFIPNRRTNRSAAY